MPIKLPVLITALRGETIISGFLKAVADFLMDPSKGWEALVKEAESKYAGMTACDDTLKDDIHRQATDIQLFLRELVSNAIPLCQPSCRL